MRIKYLGATLATICAMVFGAPLLLVNNTSAISQECVSWNYEYDQYGNAYSYCSSWIDVYLPDDFNGDTAFYDCVMNQADNIYGHIIVQSAQSIPSLYCVGNQIQKIRIVSGMYNLPNLSFLSLIDQDELEVVDVSGSNFLHELVIAYDNSPSNTPPSQKSPLSVVNFGTHSILSRITINDTNLQSISLSDISSANDVNLFNNELQDVVFGDDSGINSLVLSNNNLRTINVSKVRGLTELFLYDNEIESLDIESLNESLENLYLDDDVLITTNFVAKQLEKNGKYYASPSIAESNGGMFSAMLRMSGLTGGNTEITTSGVSVYNDPGHEHCLGEDVVCMVFDVDKSSYPGYVEAESKVTQVSVPAEYINTGKNTSMRNYSFEVSLVDYDGSDDEPGTDDPGTDDPGNSDPSSDDPSSDKPNSDKKDILIPNTGLFSGDKNSTMIAISIGAVVLGVGILYAIIYALKRSSHRRRF